jgi:hypothetical protein
MITSTRYRGLVDEIKRLREDLLPVRFNRSGRYSRKDETKTLSYRVLVHAEIEAYLEDRVWDIALEAVKIWKEKNKVSKIILALLAFSGRLMEKPPNSMYPEQQSQTDKWDEKIKLSKKIDLAMNDFHRVLEQNHGIKEENVMSMLLPIGVDCEDLDVVLLADLNSYGESRGIVAHKSSQAYRTQQQLDPNEELKKVKTLVKDLNKIDSLLNKLIINL